MTRAPRRVLGAGLAVAVTAAVVWLSQAGYGSPPAEALVRLSWRARSERVQECRQLSAAEIAALPEHMRRTEECEGRVLPYRLRVTLDGREMADALVRGGGARGDRPVYVFRDLPVAPGEHRLSVHFVRQGGPATHHAEAGRRLSSPARLELEEEFTLAAGQVLLVTYDPDRAALVARSVEPR
jgi:hypothetical protein